MLSTIHDRTGVAIDSESADVQLHELDNGAWSVVSTDNRAVTVPDEDAACALQRAWRALVGLDPMTGEHSADFAAS